MSLKEYTRKRELKKTAEHIAKAGIGLPHAFVIQKHYASPLHYDLRLEMDGTLKSWALPSVYDTLTARSIRVRDYPVACNGLGSRHFRGIEQAPIKELAIFIPCCTARSLRAIAFGNRRSHV